MTIESITTDRCQLQNTQISTAPEQSLTVSNDHRSYQASSSPSSSIIYELATLFVSTTRAVLTELTWKLLFSTTTPASVIIGNGEDLGSHTWKRRAVGASDTCSQGDHYRGNRLHLFEVILV